jgi:hypothetical protein
LAQSLVLIVSRDFEYRMVRGLREDKMMMMMTLIGVVVVQLARSGETFVSPPLVYDPCYRCINRWNHFEHAAVRRCPTWTAA